MSDSEIFTIGELARRVGVTVRTIQYYDQQGLLSPSAKGPQNQRLYTPEDETTLYRILSLKYLNLSLSDIAQDATKYDDPATLHALAERQLDALQDDFQNLLRRMTALRGISDSAATGAAPDWSAIADGIETKQAEPEYFWRMTAVREDCKPEVEFGSTAREATHLKTVSEWHNLVADAIASLSSDEPLTSPRNADLARRHRELLEEAGTTDDGMVLLMENMSPHGHAGGAFDEMRSDVMRHLKAISDANSKGKE